MGFNPLCSEGMLKLQSVEGKDDDSGCHPALRADIVVAIVDISKDDAPIGNEDLSLEQTPAVKIMPSHPWPTLPLWGAARAHVMHATMSH